VTFNSISFAVFFAVTYVVYLLLGSRHRLQNRWLLAASCFFYGWWDWRFLFLMTVTIGVDYFIAQGIARTEAPRLRKRLLALSIVSNLTVLGFFKYFNFFLDNFNQFLSFFGISVHESALTIILPIGISFYTFQAMSYVIDVYRKELKPADDFLDYAAFITYFPQLVAGPIERGTHLLPQILKSRIVRVDEFYEGCYLIFWGLFQKVFVADNLARIVDPVFLRPSIYDGVTVLIAVYAFAFQIYCDFSGYSDIARGLGKCMGFDIMINFNLPYFSTRAREFWQRWHISLSTWLRDYLYIPLGGNKRGQWITYRNLMLTMLLGGLWHGARWTFVLWGVYHAMLLIGDRAMEYFSKSVPAIQNRTLARIWFIVTMAVFFHLTCIGWLLFRATSLSNALELTQALLFRFHPFANQKWIFVVIPFMFYAGFFVMTQCYQFFKKDLMAVYKLPRLARWIYYYFLLFGMLFWGGIAGNTQFIYFQF